MREPPADQISSPISSLTPSEADTLWNLLPDGLLLVEPDGRIAACNDAALAIFGAAGDDLVGRPVEALIDDRVRVAHERMRDRWIHAPAPRLMGSGRTFAALTLDERTIHVQVSLNPVRLEDRLVTVAVVRDVTDDTVACLEQAIARDELMQTMFGLTMSLRSVIAAIEPTDTAGRLAAVVEGLGDVVETMVHGQVGPDPDP